MPWAGDDGTVQGSLSQRTPSVSTGIIHRIEPPLVSSFILGTKLHEGAICFGGEVKITLRQAFDLVSPDLHSALAPCNV